MKCLAPEVLTYASSSGGINVYHYGSAAADTDYVQLRDVQTGYYSGDVLNNHTTALGAQLMLGTAPGQINQRTKPSSTLIPRTDCLPVSAPTVRTGSPMLTSRRMPGRCSAALPSVQVLYVGLEDEINGASDFNYQDDTFVFSGVSAPSVAATLEPSSWLLLSTGLLGVPGFTRRRMGWN